MSQQFLAYLLLSMEIGDFEFRTVQQKNQFYMNNYIKYYSVLYDSLIDKALSWLSGIKADEHTLKLKNHLESILMSISRVCARPSHRRRIATKAEEEVQLVDLETLLQDDKITIRDLKVLYNLRKQYDCLNIIVYLVKTFRRNLISGDFNLCGVYPEN